MRQTREQIRALSVEINPVTEEAEVEVVLRDASDANRRVALEAFHELEDLFYDEVVLAHNFVGRLHDHARAAADARRHFQFA